MKTRALLIFLTAVCSFVLPSLAAIWIAGERLFLEILPDQLTAIEAVGAAAAVGGIIYLLWRFVVRTPPPPPPPPTPPRVA